MSSKTKFEIPENLVSENVLELSGISKFFGQITALKDVSLHVKKGEILAVLGENGSGKSTLMKILSGLYQPDGGRIKLNKKWFGVGEYDMLEEVVISNPREAMKIGLGMVYQHFQLVEPFTVAENITLGKEFSKEGIPLIDLEKTYEYVEELSKKYGLPIDPRAKVEDLPVGLKQRVEILKQLYRDAELLILDEPSAVLTPQEVDELFKTMRSLKKAGKSQIFISHKLHEPLKIADRIVVIRGGEMVGEILPKDATKEILAEMVVGKKLMKQKERKDITSENPILEVKNLSLLEEGSGRKLLDDINFTVHENQIVGVAGVVGNGQKELLESIMGLKKNNMGSILFHENGKTQNITDLSTLEILKNGIGYIPEDRSSQGLVLDFQITDNIWLAYHSDRDTADKFYDSLTKEDLVNPEDRLSVFKRLHLMPKKLLNYITSNIVSAFDVRTESIHTTVRNLSGGNQQKILLGREFSKFPRLIIASEPTRGVDIGVMSQVHKNLITMRDEGAGVLVVSSDLDEVLSLADYLLIMYNGKIAGQGPIDKFTLSDISQLMTAGEITHTSKSKEKKDKNEDKEKGKEKGGGN